MAATTVNPAVLNALTLKYKQEQADLDSTANRQRINYNSALQKMKRTYDDTALQNAQGLSDRGMQQSGPALASNTKLRDTYNRAQSEAGTLNAANLADIAKKRILSQQTYNNNRILAALGMSSG